MYVHVPAVVQGPTCAPCLHTHTAPGFISLSTLFHPSYFFVFHSHESHGTRAPASPRQLSGRTSISQACLLPRRRRHGPQEQVLQGLRELGSGVHGRARCRRGGRRQQLGHRGGRGGQPACEDGSRGRRLELLPGGGEEGRGRGRRRLIQLLPGSGGGEEGRGGGGVCRGRRRRRRRRRAEVPGGAVQRQPDDRREAVQPEAQGVRGALQGPRRARRRPPPALLPAMQPVPRAVGVRRHQAQLPPASGGAQRAAPEELARRARRRRRQWIPPTRRPERPGREPLPDQINLSI